MDHLADRLRSLRCVQIFAATPAETMVWLAESLVPMSFPPGATVVEKGEPGDALYLIVEGHAGAYDGDLLLNALTVGEIFGEMALLDGRPRSASVRALTDLGLYRLDRQHFYDLLDQRSDVARAVIDALCQRVRAGVLERGKDFAYIRQVALIAAAAQDLERGVYAPEALDEVTWRTDTLGHLARMFRQMAREVHAREQALQRQVRDLRIEIDRARQASQVDQIVGTDYFQVLQQRAAALRHDLGADDDHSAHSHVDAGIPRRSVGS